MKRFILFFAHSSMLIFVFLGSDFSVFGQTQNEIEEIIEVDGCTMNLDEGVEITIEDVVNDSTELITEEVQPLICVIGHSASFEGGMDYFKEIVNNQMRFSETMKEGRVFIQFVVEKTGKVSEIKVVKGLSEENDKEALRIMTLISEHYDWIPAKQRDKTVKVRMNIPIFFKRQEQLKSNTEQVYKR